MFTVSKKPTIIEIHNLYKNQQALPSEITKFFLNRSKQVDSKINSVLRFNEENALKLAIKLDEIVKKADKNNSNWFSQLTKTLPLFGIPFNLKDNIQVEGLVTTAASQIIKNYNSTFSATVYQKLEKAGAILISKSNLDEWAVGGSTENSSFGVTKNPHDFTKVPGGSSGGPAANTASGQSVFSIGSDTGGSVRIPASFCGLVGNKPTYGMISRYGVMPLSSSLDQVGVFTNSVYDNAVVNWILYGSDFNDQTTIDSSEVKFKLKKIIESMQKTRGSSVITKTHKPLTIGLPIEYFESGLDPEISKIIDRLVTVLKKIGHKFVDVSLPLSKYGLAVYYTLMTVETASNLQRYDGVRYGEIDSQTPYFSVRKNYFGDEPKRRIMLGTFASSSGYLDQYYNKANKVRAKMITDFENVLSKCDLLLTPTSPEFAFEIGNKTSDPVKMYLTDILVYMSNLTKAPSISVPVGFSSGSKKLPTGVQIIGRECSEAEIYNLSLEIEQLT